MYCSKLYISLFKYLTYKSKILHNSLYNDIKNSSVSQISKSNISY